MMIKNGVGDIAMKIVKNALVQEQTKIINVMYV
jgi:hypothetical protein